MLKQLSSLRVNLGCVSWTLIKNGGVFGDHISYRTRAEATPLKTMRT